MIKNERTSTEEAKEGMATHPDKGDIRRVPSPKPHRQDPVGERAPDDRLRQQAQHGRLLHGDGVGGGQLVLLLVVP